MTDSPDFQKNQQEFLDSVKKMMEQGGGSDPSPRPEPFSQGTEDKAAQARKKITEFNLKPRDIKNYLDRFVIQQEEAKRVLATAICDHYNHIARCTQPSLCKNYSKQNVIMLGPTGVGKTYLIKSLSELIGVPFAKSDATKYSETGYAGGDVEELVRDLVHRAQGEISLAECGMVYLDEIDKIASASNLQTRDVSGAGVQRGLLKIMEETEVPLRNPQDLQSQLQGMMEFQQKGKISKPMINTRHILFIVSGAFDKLAPIIERREKSASAGFSQARIPAPAKEKLFRHARTEDFVEYGLEPEFIGRLPVRVVCDPLSEEDLFTILTSSEGSILRQYEQSFAAYGISIKYEEDALWEIAKQAAAEGTGARGLVTVLERIFRGFKYELPSSHLRQFSLTREIVNSPESALEKLLREERKIQTREISQAVRSFEEQFLMRHGIRIEFSDSGMETLHQKLILEGKPASEYLEQLLINYPYGLGLVQKHLPRDKFMLDREAVLRPNAVLEEWIRRSYEKGGAA